VRKLVDDKRKRRKQEEKPLKLSLADTHCCCDSSLFWKAASLLPGVHQQKGVGHAGAK